MNCINNELIRILKLETPPKKNTVSLLMDIIPIGKEAAYRRLRGEIPFTLEEATLICRRLNLSMDILMGTNPDDVFSFHVNTIFSNRPVEGYYKMISQILGATDCMRRDENCSALRAYRVIPQEFLFKYDSLSRINIYILFYQLYLQSTPKELTEIEISKDLFNMQHKLAVAMHSIDNTTIILDKKVFVDYIEMVKYFQSLGMIDEKQVDEIKRDLLSLLDDIEKCASSGLSFNKKKMDIYVCHISFDCTYTFIECSDIMASSVGIYCVDHLSCTNPDICRQHKQWIKSLIRFSSLISVSGELLRNEFFHNQRQYVNAML
ncbi:helix-turn-helix domain-containing protein [Dysgonomonas sp. 511]|uniref:helix-turn-helix domain-containing protein n=1 Tax=Dysgonomonas sp. 511 TaxID=2302930 RepID=UPI0013D83D07|nr:helix-turn-helix domain-containing protein [Dysgonomonas sp. 511]NDV78553.1 hypothetical protein [Dysgonomonas sp. 511]